MLNPDPEDARLSPTIQRVTHRIRQTGCLVLLSGLVGPAALAQQPAPSVAAAQPASAAAPLVIHGVTVIDVQTGEQIPDRTVLIAGRRIQTIAAGAVRLPSGASVVDGRGRYLIPGLWDMHTHGRQRSLEHAGAIRSSCWGPAAEAGSSPATEESGPQFLPPTRPHSDTTATDDAECAARAAQFIRNGTWLTPTLGILFAHSGNDAGEDGKRLVRESYRFGIPMLAGSDLTQPPALTDELKLLVAAGQVADLVLLDADPLADITNTTKIRAVVANGRYYDRSALDGLLVEAQRASAAMRPDTADASP